MGYSAKQSIFTWGILNGWETPNEMFNVPSYQGNANQTTLRFHLTLVRMAKLESGDSRCWRSCGEKETLLHYWWDCKLVQPLWKSVWCFLIKVGRILLEDPTLTLLGIYSKDSPACYKDTCSTIFIAAIFIIARSWKEPRSPSKNEWIQKNVVYIHNGVLFSH